MDNEPELEMIIHQLWAARRSLLTIWVNQSLIKINQP